MFVLSESDTFNYLELKSMELQPKTPILEARLSRALEPLPLSTPGALKFSKKYKRSIINWASYYYYNGFFSKFLFLQLFVDNFFSF